jgi:hypothetical protein
VKTLNIIRSPAVITGCILLVCLAGNLLWRSAYNANLAARIAAVARELKDRPEFSGVYVVSDRKALNLEVRGKVQRETDFTSLTNLLSSIAPDVPIGIWIDWPTNRDSKYESAGAIATTVGEEGRYNKINDVLSAASFLALAVFLCSVVSTGFWHLWAKVCVERKAGRDLFVLILTPFFSLVLAAIVWWNSPSKGLNWNPWLILFSFFITAALFTYCVHSAVKGRYRLLSFLGILASGLTMLPECLIVTMIAVEPFMK